MEDNTPLLKQKQSEGKVNKEEKPKSKRSVRSEAQLQALAKGREKRFENLHKNKKDLEEFRQIKEQQQKHQQEEVKHVQTSKPHKGTGVSKKEVVIAEESDDDSSEATPVIIKKKKTKKPKVIYVESDDSESADEAPIRETKFKELKNKKYNKKPTPSREVKKQNFTATSENIDYSKFFC